MDTLIPSFDLQRDMLSLWSAQNAPDTAINMLMGALVAVACGWLGCLLILQGLALIGDAISHTVLLGIVVAFLALGSVSGVAMLVAATITGVLTVVAIDALHASSRLKEDAAIGIVFTSLFALGIALLGMFASRAHIDTAHVLYGNLEFVAAGQNVRLAGLTVPVVLCQMTVITFLIASLILLFYKELLIVAFDPQLAASLGLRPILFRYGLLGVLSLTAVGSFWAVGAILVVAMLIAPAATAFLLTRRLPAMFALSAIAGVASAVVGYHLGYWLDVPAGSAIVCVACGLFGVAFLLAPEQGVVSAVIRRLRRRAQAVQENLIRRVWKLSGGDPAVPVPLGDLRTALGAPGWQFRTSVASLVGRGWIEPLPKSPGRVQLTERGSAEAQRLDRAHRLWERFLVDQVGLPMDHVHLDAEEVEHVLSERLVERLDDILGHPETDPHGAPIPRSPVDAGQPGVFTLSQLRTGDTGRIAGLAAMEPAATPSDGRLDEISRLGLSLGQQISIIGRQPSGEDWTVRIGPGREVVLPHSLADTILVRLDGSSQP